MSEVNASSEIPELLAEIDRLRQENAVLLKAVGGTTPEPTPPIPVVTVNGLDVTVQEDKFEEATLAIVIAVMMLLWAIPFARPFKRYCETRRHRVVPIVTVINIIILLITLHEFQVIHSTTMFFSVVKALSVLIDKTQTVLMACAAAFFLFVAWHFKDRVLEAVGVENPQVLIGDCRDWVTCWSMQRFRPVELHIWKVEDLPALKMHSGNDVFVEVNYGYNLSMRTRVHPRGGYNCTIKESMQLNYDPFDKEQTLHLNVRNQDVIIASDIATVQLSTNQINRLTVKVGDKSARTLGSTTDMNASTAWWNTTRFEKIDLVPKGVIWVRFVPVDEEELQTPICPCSTCPCSLL